MKLFGSNKKSKHTVEAVEHKKKKPNIVLRLLIILVSVTAVLAVGGYAYLEIFSGPPDISSRERGSTSTGENTEKDDSVSKSDKTDSESDKNKDSKNNGAETKTDKTDETDSVPGSAASGHKYTFAILGMDDGNGNSDTIMTATFDADNYTLNVVSIPRDTLVNVSWYTKKANTWYSSGGGEKGVMNGMRDILGYELDYYVIIDLDAFEKLVDGIGGVYYDVPQNMNYKDPYQDLYINIKKGPQVLNGEDAMKVVRFRRYADGDIKRISVQQDFLKAMVQQVLQNVSSIPITTLADIVINDVDTDMDYTTILWFAREFMKLSAENVTFQTLPANYFDAIVQKGTEVSYVTIYVNQWLEMINTYLNPFDEPIQKSELDILTRDSSGKLYATSGVRRGSASWGS